MSAKKIFLGCGGFLAMMVAIVVLVFQLTAPVVAGADAFFAQLGAGQVEQAYQSTAAEFKSSLDSASFADLVKSNELDQFQRAGWGNRQLKNSTGKVSGTLYLRNGKSRSLEVYLLHQQGSWKVAGFREL